MKKSWIIILVVVAVIAWMGITLANNKKKIDESKKVVDRSNIAIPVSAEVAFIGPVAGSVVLPASLEPVNEADVTVSVAGKIDRLNFDLGTIVRKGQVLGSLETTQKELSLKSTGLSLKKLEADYKRYKELYEKGAATEVQFNDVKFNYENTKIQYEQIREQIVDSRITAPVSGIISTKNIEQGEFANPGAALAKIVDISTLKATVLVNEQNVYQLKNGQNVTIETDILPGKTLKGEISFISPSGDAAHNYAVEVQLKNQQVQLKAGTFIRVNFNLQNNQDVLQIPKVALVEGTKNPYIYTVENGLAKMRKLVLGREIGDNIEVVQGLQPNEQVIVNGQINLVEGSLVEVVKSK
jgi:RND family efflux transporter MFP subunit